MAVGLIYKRNQTKKEEEEMKKTLLRSDKVYRPAAKYSHGWKVEGGRFL